MPEGQIDIFEFRGCIEDDKHTGNVVAHLMALDGYFEFKDGRPKFRHLPGSWVRAYRTATYDIGKTESWKTFFDGCLTTFHREGLQDKVSSTNSPPHNGSESTSNDRVQAHTLLKSVPTHPDRPLYEDGDAERFIDEISDVTVEPSEAQSNEPTVTPMAAALLAQLMAEPAERPLSLQFEVSGYMALLRDEHKDSPSIEMGVAAAIANGLLALLKDSKSSSDFDSEDYRHLQAAVRYFTVSEDANSDYEAGGFDDDAAVFNKVARRLGREDLTVAPSKPTTK